MSAKTGFASHQGSAWPIGRFETCNIPCRCLSTASKHRPHILPKHRADIPTRPNLLPQQRFEIPYSPTPYKKQWTDTPKLTNTSQHVQLHMSLPLGSEKHFVYCEKCNPRLNSDAFDHEACYVGVSNRCFSCAKFNRDRFSIRFTMSWSLKPFFLREMQP